MEKKDARKVSPDAQRAMRERAAELYTGGMKKAEITRIFGVAPLTVHRWITAHEQGGKAALQGKKRGRPKGGSLKGWQAAHIAKVVVDRHPEQVKLPFCLWTRDAVARLIKKRFGLDLSRWTVGRYLQRWGFTPQKPRQRAFEQDPEKVRRWLEREYPLIRAQAKAEKARIYWGDEMGLRSDQAGGRSYSPRGETPVVPGPGYRFGCNMISAITNLGDLSFMVFKERFTITVFLEFLRRLVKHARGRKVFLIIDSHPVHKSGAITSWIKEHGEHIALYFLPTYSPDLNPDEMLNNDVKENAVRRQRPHNQKALLTKVRGYLRNRQRKSSIVQAYFQKEEVQYAAL
jgi:transposase